MQFTAKVLDPVKQRSQCLIVGCYEKLQLTPAATAVDNASQNQLLALLKREDFQGKAGQALLVLTPQGLTAERLLVLGLGAPEKGGSTNPDNLRRALQRIPELLKSTPCKEICVFLDQVTDATYSARALAETLSTAAYRADRLKSKPAENGFAPTKITLACSKSELSAANSGLALGAAIATGMNLARELGDLPGNICTPSYLAKEAQKLARNQPKLSVKVLDEKQMRALGMGSLLSVSAGSHEPAKLIQLEYQGGTKTQAPQVLVGKGITFDTGGISLKPGAAMDEMKYDMCGAASVLGTFATLLELQPKIHVIGLIAAAENMPSGTATKPGDIVTSMSGQTIEILNTDAEGRLVLCDALTYAERFKPKAVVDIATLTGACVIALGNHATGLFSNNEDLAQALLKAGQQANDRAWQMPLWDEYQKQLDSNFADIANVGGREAGSITAACFLARFAKKYPWAHLDIAGTAWKSGAAKGATGRPVPLLVQYLLNA